MDFMKSVKTADSSENPHFLPVGRPTRNVSYEISEIRNEIYCEIHDEICKWNS